MKIYCLLTIYTLIVVQISASDLVDYYEDLVNKEIQRASTYQFPKDASAYRPKNVKPEDFGSYDFVVIGAGSAGAIVASRLSENPRWQVLLLEAGTPGNNFTDIPAMSPYLETSKFNWGFNSTPQAACCQATGGICPFPRGKSLGGSSTINTLVYSRGNKADYNKWAQMGNPDWSYKKVLPYFIKSENSKVKGDAGYHGYNGYLDVEYHRPKSKKIDVFLAAHQEMDRPTIDVNGKHQIGASYNNFNTRQGRRVSTENAFLNSVGSRPNLHIITEAYMEKILIDDRHKTATGVMFSHNNIRYSASITKEVVLSAGVVGSPFILLHSGIGPKAHLIDFNITLVKDLQVGYNMHDHLSFHKTYISTQISDTLYPLRESLAQFLNGIGPLTIATNLQGISFFKLSSNSTQPDFELIFVPYLDMDGFITAESGIVHGMIDRTLRNIWNRSLKLEYNVVQFFLIMLHPKTRGRIYLKSNDPYVYPIIDSKCLCDEGNEDLEKLYKGIREMVKLIDTRAFRDVGAHILPEPRCAMHEFDSRDYWLCCVRLTAMNAYHGGGTCQMGPDPKDGAVVDGRLRVHGLKKLRVADASVIRVTISGHMSAPSMMVGERAADLIKSDYN